MSKIKKIIAALLVVALIGAGAFGALLQMKKSNQKEVKVVGVDSLKSDYYLPTTTLEGHVTTSVSQSITVEDDMIIKEVYVQEGDSVSVGDPLISFDMTLVEMELNIARLRDQQIQQELDKAATRLNSLKNGGSIEVYEGDTKSGISSGTGSSDLDSGLSMDGELSLGNGQASAGYLAMGIRPFLLASFTDGAELSGETAAEAGMDSEPAAEEFPDGETSTGENDSVQGDASQNIFDGTDIQYQDPAAGGFSDGEAENSPEDNFNSGEYDAPVPTPTPAPGEEPGADDFDAIQGVPGFNDGTVYFYQVLDYDSRPYCGTGTEEDPYVFLCSSSGGRVIAKGSFFNKMAGYSEDGTKVEEEGGSWYQLEFHNLDLIEDPQNRTASCIGYYLIDGSLLAEPANMDAQMEFTLSEALQFQEEEPPIDDGLGGMDGMDGLDSGSLMTRDEAIKAQQNVISNLELNKKENDLKITQLEKRVQKKDMYSKLDGIVDHLGDPITGSSTESAFMRIKSKDGFYVTGTVSELMLDQVKEGTLLNCMSYESGSFTAEVLEVSDYPISANSYMGEGNPNVSYYTYNASVTDSSVTLRDQDWLTVTLQTDVASDGSMVLPKAFVRTENGVSYVYKDDNGTLKRQNITVGASVDGGYSVMVKGGITAEDRIAFPYGKDVVEGAKTVEGTLEEIYGY